MSNRIQEWHHQLRSSLHPALFAVVYYGADKAMQFLSAFPQFRGMILALLPNLVQAYFAALSDYYTWQVSERIYGTGSNESWLAVSQGLNHIVMLTDICPAHDECTKPVELVLLYKNIFKFPRDYLDYCRHVLLALGNLIRYSSQHG